MNNVIKRIEIDLYSPTSYEVIKAQQGDNLSRIIEFVLYNQGKPYIVPESVRFNMEGHRGDGSSFIKENCNVSNNIITAILDSDILYEAGTVEAKIVMYNLTDNSILSTIPFKIHVQKNPCDKNKIEKDKKSLIDWLIISFEKMKISFDEHINNFLNPHKVNKTQVGLGNVDNTSDKDKPVSTLQQAAFDEKADIESPTLTGIPKAPTASVNNNSTQIATTAFTQAAISNHNTSNSAHSDIRDLISGITTRLNALADSDDTTLDQLSEIVSYIKSNRTLIENITTNKINVSDIVDNLTSTTTNKPLSAKQGKILNDLITALTAAVSNKVDKVEGKGLSSNDYTDADKQIVADMKSGTVSSVNGKTGAVDITPEDIGAPNMLTANITLSESGWYRFFASSVGYSSFLVSIDRRYHNSAPENYLLSVECGYNNVSIVQLNSQVEIQKIGAIRVVYKPGAQHFFELYYDYNLSNQIILKVLPMHEEGSAGFVKNILKNPDITGYNTKMLNLSKTPLVGNIVGNATGLDHLRATSNVNVGIDATDSNAIGYVNNNVPSIGSITDGAIYKQAYSDSWLHEIFGDYRTGQIAVRGKNNGTFTAWRYLLDNLNFDTLMPRLRTYCKDMSGGDWNDAKDNGWYMASNGAHAPCTGWLYGISIKHNELFVRQILYKFAQGSVNVSNESNDRFERILYNGTWGGWVNTSVRKAVPSDAEFTDRQVNQNPTDVNSWLPLLLSGSGSVLKKNGETNITSDLLYNPTLKTLKATTITGNLEGTINGFTIIPAGSPSYMNVVKGIPVVNSDGVMEIGNHIDFHVITSVEDYAGRISMIEVTQEDIMGADKYFCFSTGISNYYMRNNLVNANLNSFYTIPITLKSGDFARAYLGTADIPWNSLYSISSPVIISDKNKKHDITYLCDNKDVGDKFEKFFLKLKAAVFRYNENTSNRLHMGGISQDVEAAMRELGMDSTEFAGFCKDIRYTYTEFDENGIGLEESKVAETDEDGNIVYDYFLRYEEFIFLCIHMTQKLWKKHSHLEKRVSVLEKENTELKAKVENMESALEAIISKLNL